MLAKKSAIPYNDIIACSSREICFSSPGIWIPDVSGVLIWTPVFSSATILYVFGIQIPNFEKFSTVGPEIQPFKIQKHLKSGLFEGRISNGWALAISYGNQVTSSKICITWKQAN